MKSETELHYKRALREVVRVVTSSLDDALDLGALAKRAGFSPYHFHRIFRAMVGETPLEMHRRLRLERAAWTLNSGGLPITEIAFCAGYETHESFTRAFRKRFNHAPSEFRRQAFGRVRLAAQNGVHFQPEPGEKSALRFAPDLANMAVDIVELDPISLAGVRHVGPYEEIGRAFERLEKLTERAGLIAPSSSMFAIYHDDPESTPPSELRADACISIEAEERELPLDLAASRLAGGRYATTIHRGALDGLADTWARLFAGWLAANPEIGACGPSFERHRNRGSLDVTAPQDYFAELYLGLDAATSDTCGERPFDIKDGRNG